MAKKIHELPQTKGEFELRGIVNGVEKDNFYKETKTRNGNTFRRVNFGIEYDKDKNWFVELNGMPKDKVYASEVLKKKGEKPNVKSFDWSERFSIDGSTYNLIGKRLGITKTEKDGKLVNDIKAQTDFDACQHIYKHLKDDMSLYVRGSLEYSHFEDDKGTTRRKTAYAIDKAYLSSNDINFEDEKFEPKNAFKQVIVFMGINQEKENDKATGRYLVQAKIVNYASIEDAEFVILDKSLANSIKKNLKPYNAIEVWGKLVATQKVDEKNSDDVWGEQDTMKVASSPYKRELVIVGANPKSIEKTVYTQESIAKALAAIKQYENAKNDFGESNTGWGSPMSTKLESPEDDMDDDVWD